MPGALGTAMSDFSPQITGFSESDFTIIGWDPPGYGKSQPPARDFKNFFQQDAEMAVKMMNNLGFQRFSLLGWSDGGITALIAAARYFWGQRFELESFGSSQSEISQRINFNLYIFYLLEM